MHEVLVNRLGGLSLPRKGVVRLTDRPDMTLDVYRGRKTTMQQCNSVSRERGLWVVWYNGYEYLGLKLGLSVPHWWVYSKTFVRVMVGGRHL